MDHLGVDNLLRLPHSLAPRFDVVINNAFQVVYGVQVDVFQFAHLGFHVPGNGNIQDKYRPVFALQKSGFDHVPAQQRTRACGGRDDDIGLVQVAGYFLQRDDIGGILLCQILRSFECAVGDNHLVQTAFTQVFCRKLYGFTGADEQNRLSRQVAEYLPGQTHGRVRDGHRVVPDHGVAAHVLGYLE